MTMDNEITDEEMRKIQEFQEKLMIITMLLIKLIIILNILNITLTELILCEKI